MSDVKCPHCEEVQSDMHNGGDPREWWNNEYVPDGNCETICDHCDKEFTVRVSWSPSFEPICGECEEDLDDCICD